MEEMKGLLLYQLKVNGIIQPNSSEGLQYALDKAFDNLQSKMSDVEIKLLTKKLDSADSIEKDAIEEYL